LDRAGVVVKLNEAARGLRFDPAAGRIAACETRGGDIVADAYILAVPHGRVRDLLPAETRDRPEFAALDKFETAPIASVHMWFDRPVMNHRHVTLIGRTIHWLFRRADDPSGQYVQSVTSAARELAALGKDGIRDKVVAELREVFPAARTARLIRCRVVVERAATFSVVPGVDAIRPEQETSIPNLWLAGDYTRTGWPATMEGAVRSGYLAAEGALAAAGRPDRLLQPPLPANFLIRPFA
jgi:uncharacterized protein with NAD-binding domain and iron-sulfur cluster